MLNKLISNITSDSFFSIFKNSIYISLLFGCLINFYYLSTIGFYPRGVDTGDLIFCLFSIAVFSIIFSLFSCVWLIFSYYFVYSLIHPIILFLNRNKKHEWFNKLSYNYKEKCNEFKYRKLISWPVFISLLAIILIKFGFDLEIRVLYFLFSFTLSGLLVLFLINVDHEINKTSNAIKLMVLLFAIVIPYFQYRALTEWNVILSMKKMGIRYDNVDVYIYGEDASKIKYMLDDIDASLMKNKYKYIEGEYLKLNDATIAFTGVGNVSLVKVWFYSCKNPTIVGSSKYCDSVNFPLDNNIFKYKFTNKALLKF